MLDKFEQLRYQFPYYLLLIESLDLRIEYGIFLLISFWRSKKRCCFSDVQYRTTVRVSETNFCQHVFLFCHVTVCSVRLSQLSKTSLLDNRYKYVHSVYRTIFNPVSVLLVVWAVRSVAAVGAAAAVAVVAATATPSSKPSRTQSFSTTGRQCACIHNFGSTSQEGGGAKIAENLRASPFIKDLSNETTFIHIYPEGQYL